MGAQEVGKAWLDFEPGWTWGMRDRWPPSSVGRVAVNLGKAGACHLEPDDWYHWGKEVPR